MKVYVLGGSGGDAGFAINGFDDFKKYINEGGSFSKESPGSPISYKLRYIHDNSIAKVVFAASYPIRTAIPRTDNIRFDVSVRLHSLTPKFADGDGSANELYGAIVSGASNNAGVINYHWSVADGGTYLVVAKDTPHLFTDDIYTNRRYNDLVGDDKIVISMSMKESDDTFLDPDDDLGSGVYEVKMIDVISSLPAAAYTKSILNFGQGDSFMDLEFEVKVLDVRHVK
jgi:thiol-activated cytolysin